MEIGKKSELEIWEQGVKLSELSKATGAKKKCEWWTKTYE